LLFCEYVLSLPMDKKELARQRAKEWYAANKKKAAQTAKEYAEKNKEALREYRKSIMKKTRKSITLKEKKRIKKILNMRKKQGKFQGIISTETPN
jgi:vacuolar-type H+-ATPase subunit H